MASLKGKDRREFAAFYTARGPSGRRCSSPADRRIALDAALHGGDGAGDLYVGMRDRSRARSSCCVRPRL